MAVNTDVASMSDMDNTNAGRKKQREIAARDSKSGKADAQLTGGIIPTNAKSLLLDVGSSIGNYLSSK
jgi:hypothetical protein